jgi:hypothetical protein
MITTKNTMLRSAMFGFMAFGMASLAIAQGNSRSFEASPDVYKVVAQSDQYLVIEITWKPGQRDQFHSHPASGVYYLNDCNMRWHSPGGGSQDFVIPAGRAFAQAPVASHSMENIGNSACRVIQFEAK